MKTPVTNDERKELAALLAQLSGAVKESGDVVQAIAAKVSEAGAWDEYKELFGGHMLKHAQVALILGSLAEKIVPKPNQQKPN